MKPFGIARDQIRIRLHDADQLHIRPPFKPRQKTHRVIMVQAHHPEPHRRLGILGMDIKCGQANQQKKWNHFFHSGANQSDRTYCCKQPQRRDDAIQIRLILETETNDVVFTTPSVSLHHLPSKQNFQGDIMR
jgi:hypothetical protein